MNCSKCITLEAERDQYAQALATVNEEALATERERDRLRAALRRIAVVRVDVAIKGEWMQGFIERGDIARAALEGEPSTVARAVDAAILAHREARASVALDGETHCVDEGEP